MQSDGTDANWRDLLRDARKRLNLTQAQLARLAGISTEALRAYESGRRIPRRQQIEAIFVPLRLPDETANDIREALGFARRRSRFVDQFETGYYFYGDELAAHTALQPWPEFVVNDAMEVDAVNSACEAIWGIDFARERATRTRAQMNLLAVASDHHFADRLVNWDEVIGLMASIVKAMTAGERGENPYFREVLDEFSRGDPSFLKGLLAAFATAEPPQPKVRWTYRVHWRMEPHGEMNFLAIVCVANEPDALAFNSWIPVDAESWRVLEAVKAAHASSKGAAT